MKRTAAAAVVLAAVTVAGCSGGHHHATKQECIGQYNAWKADPAAHTAARDMADHLNNLDLKGAVPGAQRLEAYPMPACADPAGYWTVLLKKVVALGNNGDLGILYLEEQVGEIQKLETKLDAELKRTVNVSSLVRVAWAGHRGRGTGAADCRSAAPPADRRCCAAIADRGG